MRDSEEDEDDEDYEYRRKKKRRKGNEFIIEEAEVDEDADEDEDAWDDEENGVLVSFFYAICIQSRIFHGFSIQRLYKETCIK